MLKHTSHTHTFVCSNSTYFLSFVVHTSRCLKLILQSFVWVQLQLHHGVSPRLKHIMSIVQNIAKIVADTIFIFTLLSGIWHSGSIVSS